MSGLPKADAAALEERALKMRKAMGENLADDVAGESVDSKQRRLNMIRCATAVTTPLGARLSVQLNSWASRWDWESPTFPATPQLSSRRLGLHVCFFV